MPRSAERDRETVRVLFVGSETGTDRCGHDEGPDLGRGGIEYRPVSGVAEATERLLAESVDVVVGDCTGDVDGRRLVDAVRTAAGAVPVLLCVAPADRERALDWGASDVVAVDDSGIPWSVLENRAERTVRTARGEDRERASEKRETALRRLHEVSATGADDFEERITEVLHVGRQLLDLELGYLASVEAEDYEIEIAVGEGIEAGQTAALSDTYCSETITGEELLGIEDAQAAGYGDHPAYAEHGIACYLGGTVVVDGEPWGTLCFADVRPRDRSFSDAERTVIELLVDWVSKEIKRQSYERGLRKQRDRAEKILERIGDAFFALDDEWRFTYVNDRAMELLGIDQSALGESVWEEFPQAVDSTFEVEYRRAMATQEMASFEEHYPPLETWFEVTAYPDDDGLSVYFRDVTELKEHERRLRELVAASRDLLTTESPAEAAELACEIAHEILGFDVAGLRRYDADEEVLELTALEISAADRDHRPQTIPLDSPHGTAFTQGRTVRQSRSADDPFDRHPAAETMYVPVGEHGVLSLAMLDGSFAESAGQLAELLAASTAAALDRADRQETLVRYEQVLDTVAGMVYALDEDGRFTVITEALGRRLGYDPDELLGDHVSTVIDEAHVEAGRERIRTLVDGNRESAAYEVDLIHADGEAIPVEIEISLLPSSDGDFTGTVGAVRDITELTQTREDLERERDRFSYLFEHLPDAVVEAQLVDDEPIVRGVNPAFEDVFGFEEATVIDHSLNDLILPSALQDEGRALDERIDEGEFVEREVRRRTADGNRYFLYRGVPYGDDPEGRSGFAIYTDITDRKRREQYLQVVNRVLRHNLRNDLNSVMGYTEYVAENVEDPRLAEFARSANEMAEDIVSTSEKARETQDVIRSGLDRTRPVDVRTMAERVVANVHERYPDADVTVDLPANLTVQAGDELADALRNLVENAIVHTDDGTRVAIEAADTDADDRTVAIRVVDDGDGIPEAERAIVAEDRAITQLDHASGVGLWLVKWIVEGYGGRIDFEESRWGGSAVVLELRRADDPVEPSPDRRD